LPLRGIYEPTFRVQKAWLPPTHGVGSHPNALGQDQRRPLSRGRHRTTPDCRVFHGLPGNEQNLDLAQAIRRAGWNVLTLHYRGSWGSPGTYSYRHQLEDGHAVVRFLRDWQNVALYGIDPHRIVLAGHSTGGFAAVNVAATEPDIAGLILISATDDAGEALRTHNDNQAWKAYKKDNFEDSLYPLAGCTENGLANEALQNVSSWSFAAAAPHLTHTPLLVITSDDGYARQSQALAAARAAAGRAHPATSVHFAADHAYSAYRLALQAAVIDWLQQTMGH
jgi:pimeloyl-ACP methyl ester carboxylesterase